MSVEKGLQLSTNNKGGDAAGGGGEGANLLPKPKKTG